MRIRSQQVAPGMVVLALVQSRLTLSQYPWSRRNNAKKQGKKSLTQKTLTHLITFTILR